MLGVVDLAELFRSIGVNPSRLLPHLVLVEVTGEEGGDENTNKEGEDRRNDNF